ncbi:hypothetical protein LCGC14_0909560 [marine sediment metagenome]|uniref:6-pyruvoyl tetrahydrobiopterin synthase n=1 Tax=marine sediment metagenome TaxID=412755 RepID=A0A0F9NU20_9ZZZZ
MKLSTRVFFEAAHRLSDYEGKCKRLHGHNWIVDVDIDTDRKLDKTGFIVDFGIIKDIAKKFDHIIVMKDTDENRKYLESVPEDWVLWVSFNPTCEHFAEYFRNEISKQCKLQRGDVSIKVYENYKPERKSYAEI